MKYKCRITIAFLMSLTLVGCSRAPVKVTLQDLVSNPSAFYGRNVMFFGNVEGVDGNGNDLFLHKGHVVLHLGSPTVNVVLTLESMQPNQNLDLRNLQGLTVTGKFQKEYDPPARGEGPLSNVVIAKTVTNGYYLP